MFMNAGYVEYAVATGTVAGDRNRVRRHCVRDARRHRRNVEHRYTTRGASCQLTPVIRQRDIAADAVGAVEKDRARPANVVDLSSGRRVGVRQRENIRVVPRRREAMESTASEIVCLDGVW